MQTPAASLIISTYNNTDWLQRCLWGYAQQDRQDFELIVADDGSAATTAAVVDRHAAAAAYPVRHAWQPHEGFRAGRIRNVAIALTRCEYVVLLDGVAVARPLRAAA